MSRAAMVLASTALLLLASDVANAQVGGGGSIQGTVRDASNAPVPGATVTATNVATGIATVRQTTVAGVYAVTPLPPGEYQVTVTLDGFERFVREGLVVDALSVVGLNVTLQVAGLKQEVVVSVASPPLATADARLGQTIRNEVYTALPLVLNTGGPREREASNAVLVTVRDFGPGLDPRSVDRLFEAFYTTKPSGLGMGLAICRSIIQAHGGRLWATGNEPRGAVFQFTLPLERGKTVPAEHAGG